ncbi:MAG: protein translocase subunit SecF [Pelagimonas sp.]
MVVLSLVSFFAQGLNFGIDFRGGTTIRTESSQAVDVAGYRDALTSLNLGDTTISEVFDPNFRDDQFVAMIRIGAQDGQEAVTTEIIDRVEHGLALKLGGSTFLRIEAGNVDTSSALDALKAAGFDAEAANTSDLVEFSIGTPSEFSDLEKATDALEAATSTTVKVGYEAISFVSVESVGPKVSGELIQTAALAVALAIGAVLFYIWLRFEWQFALGAVAALVHDVMLTIGVFSLVQIKFDLAIIAALLTIVGYSLNDTVVVFDRVRENLIKYKSKGLKEVLNVSINETLSRTFMTSVTTLLALIALFVLGGDVIRGFVFAMIWGVVVGTYSSIFVASTILLKLGVKRDWSKPSGSAGNQYANIDA